MRYDVIRPRTSRSAGYDDPLLFGLLRLLKSNERQVFLTLWSETAGSNAPEHFSLISSNYEGHKIFHGIKRFVVVKEGHGCSLCL